MTVVPFGDPRRLMQHQNSKPLSLPARQDLAIVMCGGGDPYAEMDRTCRMLDGDIATIIVGNDQIERYPGFIDHAVTLHPDKFSMWMSRRRANGFPMPSRAWAHRPYSGISDWSRDWHGSTGLFAIKLARELGYVHIVLCGVPMEATAGHFVRQKDWPEAEAFKRAWLPRLTSLKPYVRSWGGWTREMFGEPTREWLSAEIENTNPEPVPPTFHRGQTA